MRATYETANRVTDALLDEDGLPPCGGPCTTCDLVKASGPELEAMVRRAIEIPTRHPLARDAGGRR